MAKIGKLTEVDVRELWKHEQYDFSNWLAEPDNISYLNDILGLTLVDVVKEVDVGSYRCDILAKDETSETKIIIENQLEAVTLVNSDSFIGVDLYIPDNKKLYDSLYEKKDRIEEKIGFELDWMRLDNKKASKIVHRIEGLDFNHPENYKNLIDEVIKKVIIMRDVFKQFI